jgi:hypothetical protein
MRFLVFVPLTLALLAFAACGAHPTEKLSIAASQGNIPELQHLLKASGSNDVEAALVWAARSGQPSAIDYLVQHGADPNGTAGVNGWTVLMHAIHKNQPRSVAALLRGGAQVNGKSTRGQTALIMAAGYGYTEIVQMLLDNGADVRLINSSGQNALDAAVTGVGDIDYFTYGTCQVDAVALLRRSAPDLQPRKADLGKCGRASSDPSVRTVSSRQEVL